MCVSNAHDNVSPSRKFYVGRLCRAFRERYKPTLVTVVGSSGNDVSVGDALFSAFKSMTLCHSSCGGLFLSWGQVVRVVSKSESHNLMVSFRHA